MELAKKKEAEEKANSKKKETIEKIKAVVDGAIADTEKLSTEQKVACITEEKAAVQWSKEADPAAACCSEATQEEQGGAIGGHRIPAKGTEEIP